MRNSKGKLFAIIATTDSKTKNAGLEMPTETIQLPTKQNPHLPKPNGDEKFFLEGPHPRRLELWMLLRIIREFFRGFRRLHFVGPCVTIFGSARFKEDHPYYALAREVGAAVSQL